MLETYWTSVQFASGDHDELDRRDLVSDHRHMIVDFVPEEDVVELLLNIFKTWCKFRTMF
jgi:hypothetical protein